MALRSAPINVFLVAPALLCWGFERLVSSTCLEIRISGTSDTVEDALDRIAGLRADVMVVDHDARTCSSALARAAEVLPILLLTSSRPEASGQEFLTSHASAVVSKSDSPAVLLRSIELTFEQRRGRPDGGCLASSVPSSLDDANALDADQIRVSTLTPRERELIVTMLYCNTEPGKVIADRLCISEQTLRNHLSSIYGKLGVHNRLGLHAFAVKYGLDRLAPGRVRMGQWRTPARDFRRVTHAATDQFFAVPAHQAIVE